MMKSILECKHESAEVIHTIMGRAYISRCTSHCGQIFLEDEYNDSHVILSPDWNVVEQRDQLAAQVEALALENEQLKKEIGELLTIQYGLLIQAGII